MDSTPATTDPDVLRAMLQVFEQAMARTGTGFAAREAAALKLCNELGRAWLKVELARHGIEADEVVVDGARYRRHQQGVGRYYSLWGTVAVPRFTYRRCGVHNGPTVVPLELRAGLVERATPSFAFSVTQGYAAMPLRHYEQELRAAYREPPARSTLERLGKRLGDAIRAAIPTVEPVVRASEPIPADANALSIGLDRTTVPMAEPRDERYGAGPCRRRTKPYQRQPPPPIAVEYRMAYVGTVAIHGDDGRAVATRRFAAGAHEGPDEVIARVFAEVNHVQTKRRNLPLAIVQDGAPELWKLVGNACKERGLRPAAEVIDRFHLDERLAAIVDIVANCDASVVTLRRRWQQALDRSDHGIDQINTDVGRIYEHFTHWNPRRLPRHLASLVRKHPKEGKLRELSQHATYIDGNRPRMRYASVARRGLPVGSGVTEGACKSVVTTRFKRSGQRWFEHGLSGCLSLRALHLNDRLRPCFDRVATSYVRAVSTL